MGFQCLAGLLTQPSGLRIISIGRWGSPGRNRSFGADDSCKALWEMSVPKGSFSERHSRYLRGTGVSLMSLLNSDSTDGTAADARCGPNRSQANMHRPATAVDDWSIRFANGTEQRFGYAEPVFTILAPNERSWRRIQKTGTYAAALAFIRDEIDIEGDLVAATRWWSGRRGTSLRELMMPSLTWFTPSRIETLFQTKKRAARNIEFHYDYPADFYKLFLDENLIYSCAYFHETSESLDYAQTSKLDHICRKLELIAEDRFLDIGCGWGALPIYAAKRHGLEAVGCTLSDEQYEFATQRAVREGWADRVRFLKSDYRDVNGRFSKIASVGMFEHVGRRRLTEYFRRVWQLLDDEGLFLNHGIIRPENTRDDGETVFLRKHVFPGGELATLSQVVKAAEDAGFEVVDIEGLRPHYALTCREWVSRLKTREPLALSFVEREIYRTWLLYLAASSASFDAGRTDIYQLLLSKRGSRRKRHLTRAHIYRSFEH